MKTEKISKCISTTAFLWPWKRLRVANFSLKYCPYKAFETLKYTGFFMGNWVSHVQLYSKSYNWYRQRSIAVVALEDAWKSRFDFHIQYTREIWKGKRCILNQGGNLLFIYSGSSSFLCPYNIPSLGWFLFPLQAILVKVSLFQKVLFEWLKIGNSPW